MVRRLRLAAARHLFVRYLVAEHLERVWLDPTGFGAQLSADEINLRKYWYIVAAGGGSLFKEGAGTWLTRKEVHAFLNPLGSLSFEQVIWQSIARSYATDSDLAMWIARSRIAQTQRTELGFWYEAVRFFSAHPVTIEEIDDLCDFIADAYRRDRRFSLNGRALASLNRQMRAWHRDLEAIAPIEAARARAQ